jgi:hypothetical protein
VRAARFVYNNKNRAVFCEFGKESSARLAPGWSGVNLPVTAGLCLLVVDQFVVVADAGFLKAFCE